MSNPVFVVGPLRSGTTMLRLLMDHHPLIHMFGEFEGAVSQTNGSRWPNMAQYKHFVQHDRMMKSKNLVVDESADYETLVRDFFQQMQNRTNKPFVGAAIHSRMDMLPKLWPNAKFVHILRDPRDVARSCIGMGWVGNVYEGARYWLEPEKHWDILKSQVPAENTLTIRYEQLVAQPEQVLGDICHWLGIEFNPSMLNIDNDTSYSKPDPKYAQQWKTKLSDKERGWVEYRCGDLMKKRGYTPFCSQITRPSVLSLFSIKLQSRLYRIKNNIKNWGFSTWLTHIITKRVGPKALSIRAQQRIDNITILNLK